MGSASARKTNASKSRSPAKDRRSATRTQSADASLVSSSAPSSPSKLETPRTARYSHHLPTDQQRKGNGRVAGRNLIMWNRPRMAEKLLLHIHYECSRRKVQLPWDAIAHRFHPGSSGAAIIQHINRLRREILAEGHLVPPLTQRSSATPVDPNIRGYVRQDTEGGDFESSRPVYFDERFDDPKFNIPCDLSFLDEESMESQAVFGTPSAGSDEGDYRQDSPTPMSRTCSKSSISSMSAYETFAPQFVAPIDVVRDTRGPGPLHLQHVGQEMVEMEPNHGRHLSHGAESVANSFEGTASPNQSFETNISTMTPMHFAFSSNIPEHTHHGYRMAAFQSWSHPFMYQMALPPKMFPPAVSFDHQDCFSHRVMPFAMTSPYDPCMALDPNLMKQSIGQPVPNAATAAREGTMQVELSAAHGLRIGDTFTGLVDPDETKVANVSTSLAAIASPDQKQTDL